MALQAERRRRPISLTALIDVVFILLMFFMLTSTFSRYQTVELKAPVAGAAEPLQAPKVLHLQANGLLLPATLETGADEDASAVDVLSLLPQLALDKPVVILPDADVSVQTIVSVFEQLQAGGLSALSLGAAPLQAQPE